MKILQPKAEIIFPLQKSEINDMLKRVEFIGRVAYRSEHKITDDSYKSFISNIINLGHESVLEHSTLTVLFICDRAIAQEITRHRIASFTGESTRYVSYKDDAEFIHPFGEKDIPDEWYKGIQQSEESYQYLIKNGVSPQIARSVLPLALAQRIYVTANLREWRHILRLRTAMPSHPQMREIMIPLLDELKDKIPVVFDDIGVQKCI